MVPEMEGKVWVAGAKAGNKMVFEGADSTFGCVAAMHVGRSELIVDALLLKKLLEDGGALVIESGQARLKAGSLEAAEYVGVRCEDGGSRSIFHGHGVDGIAIVVVEDKNIFVAVAGRQLELASLVA